MIDFLKELEESFRGNGVDISGMPGEVTIEDGKLFISKHMALDFSEHDKKVTEEKDAQIRELKRQIEDLEAIIADGKKPYISISENGVSVGCECGGYHLAKQKIEELEKEIERLNRVVESKRETHILLRQRCKGEAVEFFDRNMFGSLIISSPPLEDSKRISELEDRHQSDCIRINQLLATIDVLTERYQKLREVHGV